MKILVTGGAGFIGSHIVENLLGRADVEEVRVLDNFSTGFRRNIEPFFSNPKFKLFEGDIRSVEDCEKAVDGVDAISHQAALGSVPRSIKDPITSHNVNVNGFLNILEAVKKFGVQKMVYASSSSVYGDLTDSPKVEERTGKLLSPYAATKMANELYAEVYAKNYGIQIIGFRYFNIFGSRQDPDGPYAAVIPLFIKAALSNQSPTINGDGSITRDFTFIKNAVFANLSALFTNNQDFKHRVYNVACGKSTTLLGIWNMISQIANINIQPIHVNVRAGDIQQSLANIEKIKADLGYLEIIDVYEGLIQTFNSYKHEYEKQNN